MQTNKISNIHIEKNTIGSTDTTKFVNNTGISISNANDIDVLDNEVFNVQSIMYDPQGISIANVYNIRIERNYLHDIIKTGNGGAQGINLKPADLAKISIVNNKISHIASFGSGYTKTQNPIGIIIDISSSSVALASDSINIYHNSIYLNADAVKGLNATDSCFAIGLFVSNSLAFPLTNKINFRNNIVQVSLGEKTGSTTLSSGYAVYSSNTNNPFNQLSNNVYFVSGFDYNNVGFYYTDKSNLTDWQTSTGKDAASYFQDPLYTSTLNLKPLSNSIANNHGFGGLAATDDMLVVRNLTTPDIGAIEFEALTIVTQPVAATYCLGAPASLSVITNMPGLSTYQWQTRSNDSTAWVIIPGATSNVYSYTTAIAGTKQYQCKVSAASNPDVFTTPVKHIINAAPTVKISVSDNSGKTNNDGIICSGDAATITATGSGVDVYSWSSGETTTSITKNVAGTYTVTGTSSIGCTVTSSTIIKVNTKPTVNAGADVSICDGGSANLSAISAGSLVYAWSPATGLSSTSTLVTVAKPTATTSYIIAVTDTNACFAKDTVVVTVNTINADFASKADTINKLKISFSSLSPGVTDYSWAFGDANNSNEKTPVHTYSKSGVYEVCLNTYNSSTACMASSCTNVIVGGNDPAFVAAKYSYTIDGLKVTFTDSSTNASQYYWVFGDGGFSSAKSPAHTYKKAGNYKVCLKVFNKAYGTFADNCATVVAGTPTCNTIAAFTYSVDTANNVTFVNTSTGSVNAYYWDFGNDKTSSAKNPKFKYTKAGFYFVSLAVRDTLNGCASYTSDMVKIGSLNCRANFDADIDAVNKSVKFINNSEGTVAHYFWLFGDKDYSTSATPTHSFAKAGLYNVSLTVADATGSCVDYFEKTIQIGTADCNARYTYYVDSTALKAYFYSSDLDDNTQKYWLFGDGKLSLEANPSHAYPAAGFYNVSLTTYNSTNSCMDYYQEIVLLGSLGKDCEADFAFTNQDNSQKIKFIDKSKGDIKSWKWNFDDQSTSTLQNPEHVFNTTGFYNVCLTVVNNFGISNISCNSVAVGTTVQNNCKADFSYYTDSVTRKVSFTDNSFGTIDAYHWDFGDGSTASTKNTEHTYAAAGYYLVYQEIGNTVKKCSDVSLKLLNVAQPNKFKVMFKYIMNPYSKKAGGYPVDLSGAGLGDDARLKWNFGDGTTDSTTNSPSHTYTDTSIREYNVCLTYSDPITGAEDTYCEKVSADQLCQNDINAPTAKCKPTYELTLDAAGQASLTADQLDNGSFDDCYLASKTISKTAFTTANIGNNTVKFIVTDVKGNADTIETTVVVKAATGIDNINSAVNLSVYPNPIDKMLNIRYNLLRESEIELYVTDLLGKRVASISSGKLTAGEKTITFDASALQSGSYILQLRAANGPTSQRIIIKR